MNNLTCTEVQGAMYAFPRVHFTQKAIDEAKKEGVTPDFKYCLDLLNETGIVTVPGSGFGQKEGTHHFRMTNLITPTHNFDVCL
jgi:alanine transaminase